MDHPARAAWAFVEQLDLSLVLDAVKARAGAGAAVREPCGLSVDLRRGVDELSHCRIFGLTM